MGKQEQRAMSMGGYACAECANNRSPICELCSVIEAPDGTKSRPKYFIKYTDLSRIGIADAEGGDRELGDKGEECADILERYLKARQPLPLILVLGYNRICDSLPEGDGKGNDT